jgi:predicted O-methyltransferase YrrM
MLARGFRRVKRVARKKVKSGEPMTATKIREGLAASQAESDAIGRELEAKIFAPFVAAAEDLATRAYHGDTSIAQAVEEMKRPRALSKTREDYERAWAIEKAHRYKAMEALEERYGFSVDKDWLDNAASVMACPIKRNPPNWAHGRLVYALTRHRMAQGGDLCLLDIGAAKGFSAACMARAAADAGQYVDIWSVDVIDPTSNQPRNSILDGEIKRGIWDYCENFIHAAMRPLVHFVGDGDTAHIGFLSRTDRIGFAFVDGGHDYDSVRTDIERIVPRQRAGDIILFDDFHLPMVADAVLKELPDTPGCTYEVERVTLTPSRSYAIAVRQ